MYWYMKESTILCVYLFKINLCEPYIGKELHTICTLVFSKMGVSLLKIYKLLECCIVHVLC